MEHTSPFELRSSPVTLISQPHCGKEKPFAAAGADLDISTVAKASQV